MERKQLVFIERLRKLSRGIDSIDFVLDNEFLKHTTRKELINKKKETEKELYELVNSKYYV